MHSVTFTWHVSKSINIFFSFHIMDVGMKKWWREKISQKTSLHNYFYELNWILRSVDLLIIVKKKKKKNHLERFKFLSQNLKFIQKFHIL